MSNVINLLPDSVADKIAAGEVIGRPAAAVKELLENAIDAQASHIQLVLKNAGTALIKVVDNGVGMSPLDARLCFSRHATSKIKNADDLYNLNTKGFRGEALASIAAIAQVELKTKQASDELGTYIRIEGSAIVEQDGCQCTTGTQFFVKNLFYNVPARRNFLKKESVEMKHVLDEFHRIALAHPNIGFTLTHDDKEIYYLNKGNLKQRIVAIMGKKFNAEMIVVSEETTSLNINGFIGKPTVARKTRGQQFFFVNNRFIKHNYLQHAIRSCYEGIMNEELMPFFVIFLDIDPAKIDVNVHPSKQEIKFDDEQLVYKLLKSVVQRSLGASNVIPAIDFDQEAILNNSNNWLSKISGNTEIPSTNVDTNYNPFNTAESDNKKSVNLFKNDFKSTTEKRPSPSQQNWQDALSTEQISNENGSGKNIANVNRDKTELSSQENSIPIPENTIFKTALSGSNKDLFKKEKLQTTAIEIHNKYVIYQVKTGILLIDKQAAFERIFYERFKAQQESGKPANSQQLMFPQTINLPANESHILRFMNDELRKIGFIISEMEANKFAIEAIPADLDINDHTNVIELFLENYKASTHDSEGLAGFRDKFLIALAKKSVQRTAEKLTPEELNNLVDKLFGCTYSYISPSGVPTCTALKLSEIAKLMK